MKGPWVNNYTSKMVQIPQIPKIWAKIKTLRNNNYTSNGQLFNPYDQQSAYLNWVLMFDVEDYIYVKKSKIKQRHKNYVKDIYVFSFPVKKGLFYNFSLNLFA